MLKLNPRRIQPSQLSPIANSIRNASVCFAFPQYQAVCKQQHRRKDYALVVASRTNLAFHRSEVVRSFSTCNLAKCPCAFAEEAEGSDCSSKENFDEVNMNEVHSMKESIKRRIADYESLRYAFLRIKKHAAVSMAVNHKVFLLTHFVQDGVVLIDRKELCKAILAAKRTVTPDDCTRLFHDWKKRQVYSERKFYFGALSEKSAKYRRSDSLLTVHGAELLLSHHSRRKPEIVSQIRQALIENGLFSPFVEMATSSKSQVTLDKILELIASEYPDLQFFKQKKVFVEKGSKRVRCLDLWCPELKLNIECDEYRHVDYGPNYTLERQRDIQSTLGPGVSFHHYKPQCDGFDVAIEAAKICDLIKTIGQSSCSTVSYNEVSAELSLASGVTTIEDVIAPQLRASSEAQLLRETPEPTTQALKATKDQITSMITVFEQARMSCLRHYDGYCASVLLDIAGTSYAIKYKLGVMSKDLLLFDRQSVSKAIAKNKHNRKAYFQVFDQWHRSLIKSDLSKFFGPATREYTDLTKPDPATEWLTKQGMESMLRYYLSTKPVEVTAIRQELIALGLLSPFSELPGIASAETLVINELLMILKQHFVNLTFVRMTSLTAISGRPTRQRFLDVWCDELKLNIQCKTAGMYRTKVLSPEYYLIRENEIKDALGGDVQFHYLNPLLRDFDIQAEANKVVALIVQIIRRSNSTISV